MTNNVKTKRALLGSVIALILCMAMLVGTTFAWFTDSVVSGKNQIVAGNLDVALEYLVDGKWETVDAATNIFGDSLWEPGHTEVVTLKASNVGTLALKYQLGINVVEEKTSINVAGEELKLSDYIEFGVVDGQFADRAAARAAVKNATKLTDGYNEDQVALLPGEAKEITLVVYMPESVGNEANYKTGYEAPEITLGLNLMATQLVHEDDSFGNDYDKDAIFAGIPSATVTKLSTMPTVPLKDLNNLNAPATGETTLEVAYNFATTQTFDQAAMNKYAKYHADFVVSFSNPVKANSLALGGYYAYWCDAHNNGQWLAFAIPENVAANTPVRLLETAGITMNYEELCLFVKNFQCGAVDLTGENAGTTMTVELRIYEVEEPSESNGNSWNVETGVSEVFGVYTYTFGGMKVPVASVTKNPALIGTDLTWNASSPVKDVQLEAAYTFTATEATASDYADWNADFCVSVDRDIADNQLILAGSYEAWSNGEWVGFTAPATAANQKVALLGTAGINVKYWEICEIIETFNCGVSDVADALAGATITVELVLSNGSESIVVSTNTYTF